MNKIVNKTIKTILLIILFVLGIYFVASNKAEIIIAATKTNQTTSSTTYPKIELSQSPMLFTSDSVTIHVNAIVPDSSGGLEITPSTTRWTNRNITLDVRTTEGVDKVILPSGTVTNSSNFTYTASENGPYNFIALDRQGNILEIESYVVENIDRVGKDARINPSDGEWKNKDVLIEVETIESNKKE